MNPRVLSLIIGSLLPLGCGGNNDPTGSSFATLVVTTTSLPDAVPTVAYSVTLVATGGDGSYTWSVSSGSTPVGLALGTNGEISGTPTTVGTSNFTVEVTSGDGQTDTQALSITVNAPQPPIAFMSDRDGKPEIYVMDADGSNLARLTNNATFDGRPAWSPDASKIAFESDRDVLFISEIYVMDADGSNPVRLTNNAARDFDPAWSPVL